MVSVAFAISYPSMLRRNPRAWTPPASAGSLCDFAQYAARHMPIHRGDLTPLRLRYCMAIWGWAGVNDVNALSGLSEPHGPHPAMAVRGRIGGALPQSDPARPLRQAVPAARGGARIDLAFLPHLHPPGLRHRPRRGR